MTDESKVDLLKMLECRVCCNGNNCDHDKPHKLCSSHLTHSRIQTGSFSTQEQSAISMGIHEVHLVERLAKFLRWVRKPYSRQFKGQFFCDAFGF